MFILFYLIISIRLPHLSGLLEVLQMSPRRIQR